MVVASRPTFANDAVSLANDAFEALSADDKLGLLWLIYENLGGAITPTATGSARLQFAEGLLQHMKTLSFEDQLQVMRDLANQTSTQITRAYGVLTTNTKLAFWYELATLMRRGEVVPVPTGYQLSNAASRLYGQMVAMNFTEQITLLRSAVIEMGVDPLR